MILDIGKRINDFVDSCHDFIDKNFSNPFLWIILFGVIFALTMWFISNYADK